MKFRIFVPVALLSVYFASCSAYAENVNTTYTFDDAILRDGGEVTGSATYAFNGMWTWNIIVTSPTAGFSFNFTNQANEFETDDLTGAYYTGELGFITTDYAHQIILFQVNDTHNGVTTFTPGAGDTFDLTYSSTSSPSYIVGANGGGDGFVSGELIGSQIDVSTPPPTPKIDTTKNFYASTDLQAGNVLPAFDGGTLKIFPNADASPLVLLQDFTIDAKGGVIDTNQTNVILADGTVTGAGGLEFKDSGNLTNAGTHGGVLTFADIAAYQGPTVIDSGASVSMNNTHASGKLSAGSDLTLNGTLALAGTSQTVNSLAGTDTTAKLDLGGSSLLTIGGSLTTTYAGTIVGDGNLTLQGGKLTLTGANTYTGATTINGGTLALKGAGSISGTDLLDVEQGGTFDISAANSSQTIGLLAGTGQLVLGNNNLTTTGTLDATFGGTITSTGTLSQTGSGTQVLNGSSSFSQTNVSGGVLEIGDINNPAASLTSPVTVSGGGTLMGHGSITGDVTNNGGTVHPGGSIGTLSVNGNYTQSAASTLAIEVSPAAASKLAVSGTAGLAGTLALTADSGIYTAGTQYTIVSAGGGVTGTFTTITESGQAVPFSEVYKPNEVDLVSGASGIVFDMGSTTNNEANSSGAIQSVLNSTATGPLTTLLVELGIAPALGERTQLAGTLGELRADLASIDLANLTSFQNFLVERMDRRQGLTSTMEVNTGLPGTFDVAQNGVSDMPLFGPGGAISADQPSFWVHGYGVLGTLGGEVGFAEAQYRTGGIVGGVDAKVTDTTLLGAAVAYEHTDLNLSGDSDENNIDTYRISLYGSQKLDPVGVPLTLDAALGYAFNDYHDNDFLALPTSGFQQTSRHDGNELTAEAGLSQDVHIAQDLVSGALTVVPRVGVEYDNISQDPYTTSGAPAGGLNLATNGSTLNALRSTIGARADLKLTTNNGTVVTPELRASYLHDFMDTNVTLTEAFAGAPAAGFKISGVHPGREAALVGTGVTVGFSENISATIGYDAAVREHELDHTVQVGIKYSW